MISFNMFSRQELVEMIKKSPQTKDGYFYFPRFPQILFLKGKIKDTGYFYDRSVFSNKICFNEKDIKSFLSKRSTKMDFILEHLIDNKLKEILKGLETLHLNSYIDSKGFTLEELIDTTIYITKYRYGK